MDFQSRLKRGNTSNDMELTVILLIISNLRILLLTEKGKMFTLSHSAYGALMAAGGRGTFPQLNSDRV